MVREDLRVFPFGYISPGLVVRWLWLQRIEEQNPTVD